jgi:hypothetical protein
MGKPVTLAQLQKSRTIVAAGPSGDTYRIRPLNMERYALAGELPPTLRNIALKGADAALLEADGEALTERGKEVREYMDAIVRQVVVEPDLSDVDLDVVKPVDYSWLSRIALGEEDRDGEGRRLWGREPLSVWGTFRDEHKCADDCEACDRVIRSVADIQQGQSG